MLLKRLLALTLLAALAVMPPCVLRAQWVQLSESYSGANHCVATMGSNLFAGGNGVWLSTNTGTSWTVIGLHDTSVIALAVSGTNIFAATNNNGVFLSSNNGTSWTSVNEGLPNGTSIAALAVGDTNTSLDSSGPPMLFAGAQNGVFLSTNNGTSWTAINNGLFDQIDALLVNGTNLFAGVMGAGTDGGVFLSTNNGASWTSVKNNLPINDITALAESGTVLFAGTHGAGIFRSTNNGTSWTALTSGLTNLYVNSLAVSGTNVFAGTDDSMYLSTDNGTTWTADGLPNLVVYSLAVTSSYVFAGTDSYVWRFPLSELDTSLFDLGVNGTINDTVAFGSVPVGTTALRTVSPYNAAKEQLTIQPVEEPGNDFTTSDLSGAETLDSGESFTFEAFFEPTDTGYHSATLTLLSQAKIVNIFLTGTGYVANDVKNSAALKSQFSAYPNPFAHSTTLSFVPTSNGYAAIAIYNSLGQQIGSVFSGELTAGEHTFTWEPSDLPDGMYECLVRMNGQIETLPVVLMR